MPTKDLQLYFCPMAQPPSKKALLAFQKEAGWAMPRAELENILKADGRRQWVSVELDKVKIGIARLELAPPEFCHISDLVIKEKYRGQGVGRWFLRNIEMHCSRFGIRRLLLHPQADNRSFYEALSFVPDPLVAGVLKKELSPLRAKMPFIPGGLKGQT